MRIVVDLGCHPHPDEQRCANPGAHDSIGALVTEYQPDILFGFDPHPDTEEGVFDVAGTPVVVSRAAAWLDDAGVMLQLDGWCTAVVARGVPARSFDFAAWLQALPADANVIIKMDIEGAEYQLLGDLHDLRLDRRLSLLVLETHADQEFLDRVPGVEPVLPALDCPVIPWWM